MVVRSSPDPKWNGLGVTDTVSIIVGIVIGTAIFSSPPRVFHHAGGASGGILLWLVGGLLSFCGALCYSELATTFPRNGGDYEYLTRAYGRWTGFFFGWAQLTVILSGNIGSMAYAFAEYGRGLFGGEASLIPWMAAAAVFGMTSLNLVGLVAGKSIQNLLTFAKVVGLGTVMIAGIVAASFGGDAVDEPSGVVSGAATVGGAGMGLALVFVMYAYGGWNDAAFVAAEVRSVRKNLPRALFIGLGFVTIVYMAINLVYLFVLGYGPAAVTSTPAADVAEQMMGPLGDVMVRLLVMVSALGAINGLILTGSRVYVVFGQDNAALRGLGRWNAAAGTPTVALIVQGMISIAMILIIGTRAGQSTTDTVLRWFGLSGLPWEEYFGGFGTLVAGTAPIFWFFFLLTGVSVFVLRLRVPVRGDHFRMPLFPLPALFFCASCGFMLFQSAAYARWLTLIGVLPLLLGIPFGFCHRAPEKATDEIHG